jgi:type III secretion protein C
LLGAAFSAKINRDDRRNLMIFIRPKIVDTEDEIQNITKHNQDIYRYKNCLMNSDEYETVEALDLLNVKKTLHPEDEWDCDCDCP